MCARVYVYKQARRAIHWEDPQEIIEGAEVWRRNEYGEMVTATGHIVTEQKLRAGNIKPDGQEEANMFLWNYPEYERSNSTRTSAHMRPTQGFKSSEFSMPPSVDAHGVALTELVEALGPFPQADIFAHSTNPEDLRKAAKMYEGLAMIHESVGQKQNAIAILLQAVHCQERAIQFETGLVFPSSKNPTPPGTPRSRSLSLLGGGVSAADVDSDPQAISSLKVKLQNRVQEDMDAEALAIASGTSIYGSQNGGGGDRGGFVHSRVIDDHLYSPEDEAWLPAEESYREHTTSSYSQRPPPSCVNPGRLHHF